LAAGLWKYKAGAAGYFVSEVVDINTE